MYKIIKNVIENKAFELSDIISKIDTQWVQGRIGEDEKNELISLARSEALPQNSIDVYQKLKELEERVKNLENGEESANQTLSDFVVGKTYYKDDKVIFGGKTYICIAPDGAVCVWSPGDYPAYWQEA